MKLSLYDGEVQLEFKDTSHRYTVNGKRVEGVTTILSRVTSKDGLIGWAANMAVEAMVNGATPEEAKKAHTRKKEAGGNVGTLVHKAIEAYLAGDEPLLTDPQAIKAFGAFQEWEMQNKPKYLDSEKIVYSKAGDYCGTFDVSFELNGKRYLADFKTANPRWSKKGLTFYPEHFLQIAAYDIANYEECGEEFDAYMILYITKDGKLHTFETDDVADWQDGWLWARDLSRLLRKYS